MIRNGGVQDESVRKNTMTVLQAYFAATGATHTEEDFINFWNSLSTMEKEHYLHSNLPLLFYRSGAA